MISNPFGKKQPKSGKPSVIKEVKARDPRPGEQPIVHSFGSSVAELFDYIFGEQDRFRSHWASGWSARGFSKKENRDFFMACMDGYSSQDIILMQFGSVDVQFNVAHRMATGNFMDPEGFCQEAANGFIKMVETLHEAGFKNVYCVFASAPVPLPAIYFRKKFNLPSVPARYQAQLFARINELIATKMPMIDLTKTLANDLGLLKQPYRRTYRDHHADYIKIQGIVWNQLKSIDGIAPCRETFLTKLYPHRPKKIKAMMEKWDIESTDIKAREVLKPKKKAAGAKKKA
ncbi:hypothetical protein HJ526_11670 [Donghicola sp. C2-DW-16]|uniref:GNAT family N-acetyltransferase n=1 Tax=Donghicola mangrovi TaxID=2729614 RepID=A0ABX2PFB6_9RHOB|nr:hypothetical protein [Donghicola mangrovi]NVO28083.1 hypothetical protein [Donghicola mangrovi]